MDTAPRQAPAAHLALPHRAAGDGYEDGLALRKAAKKPTKVWVQRTYGGHLNVVWKPLVPEVFRWLSGRLSGVQDIPGGLRPHSGATLD